MYVIFLGQCSVCHKATTDQVMSICQHKYCRGCLAQLLHTSPCCVVCKKVLQQVTGNQPDGGKMSHKVHQSSSITGYEKHGTIIITYEFPKGVQGPDHPHYVRTYTAYLPNSPEGREVLTLLERAFDAKLIFTVGRSGAIIWSNIEHKTNLLGGPNQ